MGAESGENRPGLGKVIYSVDDHPSPAEPTAREANREVDEDSKESFPASDPPAFTGGSATKDAGSEPR